MSYSDTSSLRMLRYDCYLRSFKVIQTSSYLNDPTIIKPKKSKFHDDFFRINLNKIDLNMFLLQLYLISLSCIVDEYSTSRVMPRALRLCFISSRA